MILDYNSSLTGFPQGSKDKRLTVGNARTYNNIGLVGNVAANAPFLYTQKSYVLETEAYAARRLFREYTLQSLSLIIRVYFVVFNLSRSRISSVTRRYFSTFVATYVKQ